MLVRGSGSGLESKRYDNTFYKGIVVKNNDPLKMNRVKIFIPELSNQPYDDWLEPEETEFYHYKVPGKNQKEPPKTFNWKQTKIFEEISKTIPWAEPCFPLFGESGPTRYYSPDERSTISDCNYEDGFQVINEKPPNIREGTFSPSYLWENYETITGDAFCNPLINYSVNCNTYGAFYRSSKHSNMTKGLMGIPEVGSKVWVFHYQGDLQFPVYFGVFQDQRSLTLINGTNNDELNSESYPGEFENKVKDIKKVIKVDE